MMNIPAIWVGRACVLFRSVWAAEVWLQWCYAVFWETLQSWLTLCDGRKLRVSNSISGMWVHSMYVLDKKRKSQKLHPHGDDSSIVFCYALHFRGSDFCTSYQCSCSSISSACELILVFNDFWITPKFILCFPQTLPLEIWILPREIGMECVIWKHRWYSNFTTQSEFTQNQSQHTAA